MTKRKLKLETGLLPGLSTLRFELRPAQLVLQGTGFYSVHFMSIYLRIVEHVTSGRWGVVSKHDGKTITRYFQTFDLARKECERLMINELDRYFYAAPGRGD